MFTRQQVIEYFTGQYTESSVLLALQELAKVNPEIDPNASEFSTEILTDLEKILQSVGEAINSPKTLPGTNKGEALTIADIGNIAQHQLAAQDIELPTDVLMAIARTMISEQVATADILHEISKQALINRIQSNRQELAQDLVTQFNANRNQIQSAYDKEIIALIANNYSNPVSKQQIESFLDEVAQNLHQETPLETGSSDSSVSAKKAEIEAFLLKHK